MATKNLIATTVLGVDAAVDPLKYANRKMSHAVNIAFNEGKMQTRPGMMHWPLGINGRFQGMALFRPSLGLSLETFGHAGAQLAVAAGGGLYLVGTSHSAVSCQPYRMDTPPDQCSDILCRNEIHLFQAENYLVVHNPVGTTYWWDGATLSASPGMSADVEQGDLDHSHDTFQESKFKNWLMNSADLGAYAHGRIHQSCGNRIYVSDLIHKRGHLTTSDILLMEEQSLASCGPPLSTNSKMGRLIAMELSPQMGTANGEGELVGYYEGGVVTYNTFEAPRESRMDAEGKQVTQGWDTKRLVSHRLDTISATGRYAVTTLPRDQLFRSSFGVHLLSQVAGTEVINDEANNNLAADVAPILNADDPEMLSGAAAGYWLRGQRMFVTTGMTFDLSVSATPFGKGFVSYNKAFSKTEDRTPVTVWEGVWRPDEDMHGVFRFSSIGVRADRGLYGFVSSDKNRDLYFTTLDQNQTVDRRNGADLPIEWAFETGRFDFGKLNSDKFIDAGSLTMVFANQSSKVKVYVRTDCQPVWQRWRETGPSCDRKLKPGERFYATLDIGKPPEACREAAWFEFRVEGVGWAQISAFDVEVTEGKVRSGNSQCLVVNSPGKNYLATSL